MSGPFDRDNEHLVSHRRAPESLAAGDTQILRRSVEEQDRLTELGILIVPQSYPPGFDPKQALNYEEIVNAFAHCLHPLLFSLVTYWPPGQHPGPHWADRFRRVAPSGFPVFLQNTGGTALGVLGNCANASRDQITVIDRGDRMCVMHEIGHVVHFGIEEHVIMYEPGYEPYTEDPASRLTRIFGDMSEQRRDDGIRVGFVSGYAETNTLENFAETFMHYVYYGDEFRARSQRQQRQFGSSLLSEKYRFIFELYRFIWFRAGGGLGGWQSL